MTETLVKQCFRRYGVGGKLDVAGYLAWALGEPLPVAWLPVMQRISVAETSMYMYSLCYH